jgi:hypothetical protein
MARPHEQVEDARDQRSKEKDVSAEWYNALIRRLIASALSGLAMPLLRKD